MSISPKIPHAREGRIVVGVDGSASSIRALLRGIRIANALGTNLEIATTWKFGSEFATSNWSPETDAREIVTSAATTAFGDDVPEWVTLTTYEGPAATALIDASKGAEMLVIGSRGHSGLAGVLLGSVSMACAERASCPVLVMHGEDAA
jgi:nucleotide-binding universal stress UspA family protein